MWMEVRRVLLDDDALLVELARSTCGVELGVEAEVAVGDDCMMRGALSVGALGIVREDVVPGLKSYRMRTVDRRVARVAGGVDEGPGAGVERRPLKLSPVTFVGVMTMRWK